MAQVIHSQFTVDGRFRIHTIEGLGRRRKRRVIEIEVVDTGERLHGSARWLEKIARGLVKSTETSSEQATTSVAFFLPSGIKRP